MKVENVLFKNQYVMMFVSAVLSAVLLITILFCGTKINAWFREELVVYNDAVLSNFKNTVRYDLGDGNGWKTVADGDAIPITPSNVNNMKFKVSYQGKSAGYLRLHVYGSFYNKNTGTYLPQSEQGFFSIATNNSKWYQSGEYMYYSELLLDKEAETFLPEITVNANLNSLGEISNYQDYSGELYVIVETVQPDRYKSLWNIEQLPFVTTIT